jgi:hypothetical protein
MNSSKNKIVIELIEIVCTLEVKKLFFYLNKGSGGVYGDQSQISWSSKTVEKIHRAESGVEVGTPEGNISWNELK